MLRAEWGAPCWEGLAHTTTHLLQPLQAPSQLPNLLPQVMLVMFSFPN